ncbi:acyl carrier protein [Streptomyces sp. NPDC051987]|uniref:acyl carrier protein n=1 Tax=Streptomyces sp. NPDC051987 TaxID=3155808 RepID=UPI00341CB90E
MTSPTYRNDHPDTETIRRVLREHARLAVPVSTVADSDDLYQRGMTSLASVTVMLALEDAFDIEFADRLLRKSTFSSIRAIQAAVDEMRAVAP